MGTSFAEIFFGNCTAIGLPCLTSHTKDLAELSEVLARRPEREIILDLENRVVQFGEQSIPAMIPDGARNQLLAGTWNAMGVLSEAGETTDRVARSLPYVTGY